MTGRGFINWHVPTETIFFIGTTNRNFNTRFKEHRKDFRYAEGKSKFSEHVLKEGHKMKTIEETTSITHLENNYRKINTLEEIEILKAASSKYLLNEVIAGQNDPMYKLLLSLVIWTPRSTAQAKQQNKFRDPRIKIISDLNFNCQLPKPGDRRNFNTHKTCW